MPKRSETAAAYHRWYRTARWLALRSQQLAREPLCRFCAEQGRTTAASVVDHVEPHKGNAALFYNSENLQSLCESHHGSKINVERRGYSTEIGADGFPVDRAHPFWTGGSTMTGRVGRK